MDKLKEEEVEDEVRNVFCDLVHCLIRVHYSAITITEIQIYWPVHIGGLDKIWFV